MELPTRYCSHANILFTANILHAKFLGTSFKKLAGSFSSKPISDSAFISAFIPLTADTLAAITIPARASAFDSTLARFIDDLPEDKKSLPYQFYFDNLFTTFDLLNHLSSNGYGGRGTIRENRLGKTFPLPSVKTSKKKERGSIDFIRNKEDNILLVRWTDNNAITMASNVHGVKPVRKVQRYSRTDKKVISVRCPDTVSQSNKYMGGTDRMGQNVNAYRIGNLGYRVKNGGGPYSHRVSTLLCRMLGCSTGRQTKGCRFSSSDAA